MLKNKINYKLLNFGILVLIVYLMYQTGYLWSGILKICWDIIMPFFFAFLIAYALYPAVKWLNDHKVPKVLSVGIVVLILMAIIVMFFAFAVPAMSSQLGALYNNIIAFIKWASTSLGIDSTTMQRELTSLFKSLATAISTYASTGVINIITTSLSIFAKVFIGLASMIYLLNDMDKIRNWIKNLLKKKNQKLFNYVAELDKEMRAYFIGFVKLVCICFIEYSILYSIIGHPNALLLALLTAIANLIPYFGGMAVNLIAAVTAFAISPQLLIKTVIAFIIGSNVDGYVISPLVYGKSNSIPPLMLIFSVFAGSYLFGVIGLILAIPFTIFVMVTTKFYGNDILNEIDKIKDKK